jgi:uncharacterized protein (DUF983 family)
MRRRNRGGSADIGIVAAAMLGEPHLWWQLRACPHCHGGDLYRQYGMGEWACLQCGWNGETASARLPDLAHVLVEHKDRRPVL